MRDLISSLFISLDGVVEDPHSWNPPYYNDELGRAVQALLAASDTHVYGRRSYEMFRSVFTGPRANGIPHAGLMNETPKLLVSGSIENADWGPTTVVAGDVPQRISELKEQPGKTINVQASATLVTMLLEQRLLDELHLFVHPVMVGRGKRLFEGGASLKQLLLMASEPFTTGVVYMRFAARTDGTAKVSAHAGTPESKRTINRGR
jgi:dihydrofolate reductase